MSENDERAEIERIICDAFTCDLRGRGDEDGAFWQTAADALLAAGWTRGGAEAGLREAAQATADLFDRDCSLSCSGEWQIGVVTRLRAALARPSAPVVSHATTSGDTQAPLSVTDDTQAAPETLAWAVVGEDGEVLPATCGRGKPVVDAIALSGQRVVRVAIRVVEDGGD